MPSNAAGARDLAAAVARIEALERELEALRNATKSALSCRPPLST